MAVHISYAAHIYIYTYFPLRRGLQDGETPLFGAVTEGHVGTTQVESVDGWPMVKSLVNMRYPPVKLLHFEWSPP